MTSKLISRFVYLSASALLFAVMLTGEQAMAANDLAQVPGSFRATTDADTGEFSSSTMTVEVVLAPSNQSQLSELLANTYNPQSASYQQWLGQGEFYSMFAPSSATVSAVTNYLENSGLTVQAGSSPFLLSVTGPSSVITNAFNTTLRNYVNPKGVTYYSNASAVQLPASVASAVLGVVGLSNTVRLQSQTMFANKHHQHVNPPCDTPYVTTAELFANVNDGTPFPYGYAGGPGCSGLTPSQTNSIYGAPNVGPYGQGRGATLAVFELSSYQHSDIDTWAHQFYGPGYTPPLVDINVDLGPLDPVAGCPAGDTCPPEYNYYNGDIEVVADIEMSLAIAPAMKQLLVYNAPNDFTGQTELDEYTRIAKDNKADVISSSWGVCENDVTAGYVQAENIIFEQMALQGQSMFGAAGDTGAFGCLRSDGTTIVNVGDPPSQPWVTSVGGTSFESFDPGANPYPNYPTGVETVWNVDNLCNTSANEGGTTASPDPGLFWCAASGAGGGGNSQWWGRPWYQSGPGIINRYTAFGNGSTQCALANPGTPCREVPDVSANADEYTPYAEYCTGSASTPYSTCATLGSIENLPGWFGIGGTSLSSPLWSAIFGDRDGYWHGRTGNANPLLYALYRTQYYEFFNDITGFGQSTNNNGLFPTTPGFDLATGIGTPKMGALITGVPQW
jgi:subtilase family serine protease